MSKIVVTEDHPTGRRFRRSDNGDVVAYGDELADGTVVVKLRGSEETRQFKPLFRIDLNWRHHTAWTNAARFVQKRFEGVE